MNKYEIVNDVIKCKCGILNCDNYDRCYYCNKQIKSYFCIDLNNNIFCSKQCYDNYERYLGDE